MLRAVHWNVRRFCRADGKTSSVDDDQMLRALGPLDVSRMRWTPAGARGALRARSALGLHAAFYGHARDGQYGNALLTSSPLERRREVRLDGGSVVNFNGTDHRIVRGLLTGETALRGGRRADPRRDDAPRPHLRGRAQHAGGARRPRARGGGGWRRAVDAAPRRSERADARRLRRRAVAIARGAPARARLGAAGGRCGDRQQPGAARRREFLRRVARGAPQRKPRLAVATVDGAHLRDGRPAVPDRLRAGTARDAVAHARRRARPRAARRDLRPPPVRGRFQRWLILLRAPRPLTHTSTVLYTHTRAAATLALPAHALPGEGGSPELLRRRGLTARGAASVDVFCSGCSVSACRRRRRRARSRRRCGRPPAGRSALPSSVPRSRRRAPARRRRRGRPRARRRPARGRHSTARR